MKKLIILAIISVSVVGTVALFKPSTLQFGAESLDCPISYQAPLYDTPSGFLSDGYSLKASGTTTRARVIGTQAFSECYDSNGKQYVVKLTNEEYSSLNGKPSKSTVDEIIDVKLDI